MRSLPDSTQRLEEFVGSSPGSAWLAGGCAHPTAFQQHRLIRHEEPLGGHLRGAAQAILTPAAAPGHGLTHNCPSKAGAGLGNRKATVAPTALSCCWCSVLFFSSPALPFPHSFWLWHHDSDLACFPDPLWVSDPETREAHMKIQILLIAAGGGAVERPRPPESRGRGRGPSSPLGSFVFWVRLQRRSWV